MSLKRMMFMLSLVLGWIFSIVLFFATIVIGFIEGWPFVAILFIDLLAIYAFAIFTWYLNREFKKESK